MSPWPRLSKPTFQGGAHELLRHSQGECSWTCYPTADLVNQAAEREQSMAATMRSLQQSLNELGAANEELRAQVKEAKDKQVREAEECRVRAGGVTVLEASRRLARSMQANF